MARPFCDILQNIYEKITFKFSILFLPRIIKGEMAEPILVNNLPK